MGLLFTYPESLIQRTLFRHHLMQQKLLKWGFYNTKLLFDFISSSSHIVCRKPHSSLSSLNRSPRIERSFSKSNIERARDFISNASKAPRSRT